MIIFGLLITVLAVAVFVLAAAMPKRDRTQRSKERALRIVTPADQRAARECADVLPPVCKVALIIEPDPFENSHPEAKGSTPPSEVEVRSPTQSGSGEAASGGGRFGELDHPTTISYDSWDD